MPLAVNHFFKARTASNGEPCRLGIATIAPWPSWSALDEATNISRPCGENFKFSTVKAAISLRLKAPINPMSKIALSRSF